MRPESATRPRLTSKPQSTLASPTPKQMVMRVTALRGSVPQQWVTDFQTALEGYGVAALTQKGQLAEIYAELQGTK